jgi:hypothetical protein
MKPIKNNERAKLARRLSKKITTVLSVYNMKQVDLAKDIGVNHVTFSSWCRGQSCPKSRGVYDEVMAYLDATYDTSTAAPVLQTDAFKDGTIVPSKYAASMPTLGVRVEPNTVDEFLATSGVVYPAHNDIPVFEDTITGIADDLMHKAVVMLNAYVGGPALTVKDGRMFLDILKMVRAQ